jgi:hypothetical protein
MFAHTQRHFATALLDADRPIPPGVTAHILAPHEKRFAVYRNNVVTGLLRAMKTRFPATERAVGTEFFTAMAHVFVTMKPPRSPLLMTYGDDFPDFIAAFVPAAEIPYLADVARVEAARTRAYHAADTEAIDPARLQSIPPDLLAQMRVALHPSAEVVRSLHPVVTLWAMNSGELEPGPIEDWCAQDALVMRPGLEVEVRQLPAGGAAFLASLARDETLARAADVAASGEESFDLVANLAGLIGLGLVIDISIRA